MFGANFGILPPSGIAKDFLGLFWKIKKMSPGGDGIKTPKIAILKANIISWTAFTHFGRFEGENVVFDRAKIPGHFS